MNILQRIAERIKPSTWKCSSCGAVVPKKGAELSGTDQYPKGHHVHCPRCGAIIAQFVAPSEVE